jgi:hypothetical protein
MPVVASHRPNTLARCTSTRRGRPRRHPARIHVRRTSDARRRARARGESGGGPGCWFSRQPTLRTPAGRAARRPSARRRAPRCVHQRPARQRHPALCGQLTREGLDGHDDSGGEKRAGRPPRGSSSRPGNRCRQKRCLHLLTTWRGRSRRAAMTSLDTPWAASNTSFARTTSLYGAVYLRARASSSCRSSRVSSIQYGLTLGIGDRTSAAQGLGDTQKTCTNICRHIYERKYFTDYRIIQ